MTSMGLETARKKARAYEYLCHLEEAKRCVRVCVCACVRVCVYVCMYVCMHVYVRTGFHLVHMAT
jgi:hypothetical protein